MVRLLPLQRNSVTPVGVEKERRQLVVNHAYAPIFIRKPADQTVVNSTVRVADPHFTFHANKNEVWFIEFFWMVESVESACNMRIEWIIPTGTTVRWAEQQEYISNNEFDTGVPQGANDPGSLYRPSCLITIGNIGGSVTISWAQSSAGPVGITLKKNSFWRLTKIA